MKRREFKEHNHLPDYDRIEEIRVFEVLKRERKEVNYN